MIADLRLRTECYVPCVSDVAAVHDQHALPVFIRSQHGGRAQNGVRFSGLNLPQNAVEGVAVQIFRKGFQRFLLLLVAVERTMEIAVQFVPFDPAIRNPHDDRIAARDGGCIAFPFGIILNADGAGIFAVRVRILRRDGNHAVRAAAAHVDMIIQIILLRAEIGFRLCGTDQHQNR